MQVYTFPPSPNSLKISITAEILALPLEQNVVDITAGEQREPGFLKINPNGKIPALVDNDFMLWESNAIMQYVASRNGHSALWSDDTRTQIDINRWLFWQAAHWGPTCGTFVYENFVKNEIFKRGPADTAELEKGEKNFSLLATVLNDQLSRNEFIVGNALSLADISIGVWLTYWRKGKIPLAAYPAIEKWYGNIKELAPWQKVVGKAMEWMENRQP